MNRLAVVGRRCYAALGLAVMLLPTHTIAQVHPVVGKWTWTRPLNNCSETYDYRADGTFDVRSGEEIASGKYEISTTADAKGYYMLKGQTLKTNGAKDCSDASAGASDWDKPYTVYLLFHKTQPLHLVCYESAIEKCFGPLRRVGP